MKYPAFVLMKAHALFRPVHHGSSHFAIGQDAYAFSIRNLYKDVSGKMLPIAVYHSGVVFPYSVNRDSESIDSLAAQIELGKCSGRKLLGGLNLKILGLAALFVLFLWYYLGALMG